MSLAVAFMPSWLGDLQHINDPSQELEVLMAMGEVVVEGRYSDVQICQLAEMVLAFCRDDYDGKAMPRLSTIAQFYHSSDKFRIKEFALELLYRKVYGRSSIQLRHLGGERKDSVAKDQHHYPYIAFSPLFFADRVEWLLNKYPHLRKTKFIDIGCGIGDKVLIAKVLFDLDAYGVEYTPFSHSVGTWCLHHEYMDNRLILGNAFDMDYGDYGFIYTYSPMVSASAMYSLYEHVVKTVPARTVWLEVLEHMAQDVLPTALGIRPAKSWYSYSRSPVYYKSKTKWTRHWMQRGD